MEAATIASLAGDEDDVVGGDGTMEDEDWKMWRRRWKMVDTKVAAAAAATQSPFADRDDSLGFSRRMTANKDPTTTMKKTTS